MRRGRQQLRGVRAAHNGWPWVVTCQQQRVCGSLTRISRTCVECRSAYTVLPCEQCRVGYRFSAASPEPFVKMMRPMNASATECVSFVSIETTTAWGFSGSSPKTFL